MSDLTFIPVPEGLTKDGRELYFSEEETIKRERALHHVLTGFDTYEQDAV